MFVVCEHDLAAPVTIYGWVQERIKLGLNTYNDKQIQEAMDWAATVRQIQFNNVLKRFNDRTAAMVPKLPNNAS